MSLTVVVLVLVGFAVSWAATGLVRKYVLAKSIMDVPNERSSHAVPVPRGGGLAIAIVVLAGLSATWAVGRLETSVAVALIGGTILVASVGWLDDNRGVSARYRVVVHAIAAVWTVCWLGGYQSIDLGIMVVYPGWFGAFFGVVGVMWCINYYNFMDGVDGLAAAEAVSVGVFAAVILAMAGRSELAVVAGLVAVAAGGFLVWNWQPAKLFLGDVGSGLLGYLFAGLALASETTGGPPVIVFVVLLSVFVFDATVTLLRRVAHGERWYDPHRRHAYQRLVQAGWSHAKVTTVVLLLNVVLAALAIVGTEVPALWPAIGVVVFVTLAVSYGLVEIVHPMWGKGTFG